MKIFDFYLLKNLAVATTFIAMVLTLIIFLTQSLRFLEIVINAGSSGSAFWVLTLLALPRFFEVILPLSIMAATLFLYNKMTIDSELIAIRATGHSSLALAKPAIILGCIVMVFLWVITMWAAPASLSKMQEMRLEIKSELSNFLFREGVFNAVGSGLTVYIGEKQPNGDLTGLMIHDTRDPSQPPTTILAKRGMIVTSSKGNQVVVFDGVQQQYNPQDRILQKLTFDRYTIDLPDSSTKRSRWMEPDERTLGQLLHPDPYDERDMKNLREFSVEIHRRVTSPILAVTFPILALTILLIGPVNRRGQSGKVVLGIVSVVIIQGLFLAAYNLARNSNGGLVLMYCLTFAPLAASLFLLSQHGEKFRRTLFYRPKQIGSMA